LPGIYGVLEGLCTMRDRECGYPGIIDWVKLYPVWMTLVTLGDRLALARARGFGGPGGLAACQESRALVELPRAKMSQGQNSLPYATVGFSRVVSGEEAVVAGEHFRHPLTETLPGARQTTTQCEPQALPGLGVSDG
jgi:hypothetical protein